MFFQKSKVVKVGPMFSVDIDHIQEFDQNALENNIQLSYSTDTSVIATGNVIDLHYYLLVHYGDGASINEFHSDFLDFRHLLQDFEETHYVS